MLDSSVFSSIANQLPNAKKILRGIYPQIQSQLTNQRTDGASLRYRLVNVDDYATCLKRSSGERNKIFPRAFTTKP
jgi:hypothetical protein